MIGLLLSQDLCGVDCLFVSPTVDDSIALLNFLKFVC
jgi:hypothetical protein